MSDRQQVASSRNTMSMMGKLAMMARGVMSPK